MFQVGKNVFNIEEINGFTLLYLEGVESDDVKTRAPSLAVEIEKDY